MKRVSEVVTIDEVKSWKNGDIITISAGTGVGKSYFVKNILYAHAQKENKKILFLIHRRNCVNQFQKEIERDRKKDIIHIKTYQWLEKTHITTKHFDFSEYKYIVCDEFHYFMQDAKFNKFTDISLNAILEQKNKIRIFMSATGDMMKRYINNFKKMETIDYHIPIKYQFIKNLVFFNKDESIEQFIHEAIEKNIKAIFFFDSAEKAYNLYAKHKDYCLFNCSKHNKKYYQYVNEEKINRMLENERFEELILITTTCMDAGVNIIDSELSHIVCDVDDMGTLIQCIGRKRLKENKDGIHLYIKAINNNVLGGKVKQIQKRIEMARFLRKHSIREYIEKYPREYDSWNIVYNDIVEGEEEKSTLKVNDLIYFKCLIDGSLFESMLREPYGYAKHLAREFGFYDPDMGYQYTILDEEYEKQNIDQYLESIVGKKLYKDEQKELIDKIDLRVDGRQQRSYKKLNYGLEMIKLSYIILPKKSGSVRYWIVEKVE
ncbi:DNA helicase [Bacillus methanolicus]|uniref:DEAD/DEAH box helicase family protein n=1 Tax=Bacillus methanolicus TaxID=1471 RepID=UPI00200DEA16|nr:DEAD/DEAH box helicase family protein [Bacillus methanolicus]UQD51238.1 DNA helicase [Bacillus methanolicus]